MKLDKRQQALAVIACVICAILMYTMLGVWMQLMGISVNAEADIFERSSAIVVDIPTPPVKPIEEIEPVETAVADTVESAVESAYGRFNVPLSDDLQEYIFDQCIEKNVAPELIFAMIYVESSYRSSAIGDGGASFGLMQIQPRWHQGRMDKLGCTDLLDPYQNVKVGIDYISDLLERKGSVEWALMAYNAGPSVANKKLAAGETTRYVTKVFEKRDKLLEEYE